MQKWFLATLLCGLAWPASASAQETKGSDVVVGYHSKRVRHATPRSVQVERQLIHGRVQKPHVVFQVERLPFRFEVGTSRYSWRAEERERAARPTP